MDKPKGEPAVNKEQQRNEGAPVKTIQEENVPLPEAVPERPEQGPYIPPQEQTKGIP